MTPSVNTTAIGLTISHDRITVVFHAKCCHTNLPERVV